MTTCNDRSTRLKLESLDDRFMPSVTLSSIPDSAGNITIVGSNSSESVKVTQDSTRIIVNGTAISSRNVRGVIVDMKGGNDTVDVRGLNLPTVLRGGSGNDVMFGGSSTDRMYGDGDQDRLFGGAGYDYITGGAGSDFSDDGNRSMHEWYADESGDGAFDFVADVATPLGGARASQVSQGTDSKTCVFMASLGSMAQSGVSPNDYISYLGHDNRGFGLYNVKLFDGRQWQTYRVEFNGLRYTTDAEPTADNSSWTIIMNRAWLGMHGNRGATADEGMKALGFKTQTSYLNSDRDFATLSNWVASNGMAVAVTKSAVDTPKLQFTHAYQVVQAGMVNGVAMVRVRNPWGIDIAHKYANDSVNDGYFWMTWSSFKSNFGSVALGGR